MISIDDRDPESALAGPWITPQLDCVDRGREPNPATSAQCRVPFRSTEDVRRQHSDRFLCVWLYRPWPGVLYSILIVRPETVTRWYRGRLTVFWR